MDEMQRAIARNVASALDLIVTRTSGFKARIENMQCMAIDARLDTMDPDTTEGAVFASMLAAQQIVYALDNLVDDFDVLSEEILDLLTLTQPSKPQ